MNNKKGLVQGMTFALIFGIIAVFFVFTILLIKNFTHDVVSEVSTELQNVGNDLSLDSSTITAVADLETKHSNMDFKIDTMFIIIWAVVFMGSIVGAYFSPALPNFNFFTILLFGTMFLLFVSNFLNQIMTYLLENLITNVFTAAETNLPVFNFYMDNYYYIVAIWVSILLIANQLSKAVSSFETQLKEEVEE